MEGGKIFSNINNDDLKKCTLLKIYTPVSCSLFLVWLFMFIKVFKWSWSPGITWYWAEAEGSKYFLLIKLNLATLTCCLPGWWLTLYQHWQWIFTLHNAFNFLMSTGSLVCVKLVSIISDTRFLHILRIATE